MHQIAKCKNLKEERVIQPFPKTFGPLPLFYILPRFSAKVISFYTFGGVKILRLSHFYNFFFF